jgi:DNA-binding transcriptional MerR regulator
MTEQTDLAGRKTYYSISEVCTRTSLEPHVLRYWESEFAQLRPKKNRAGNRAYRDKDIEIIEYIKFLLYDQQYTIPGAKKKLSEMKDGDAEQPQQPVTEVHAAETGPTIDKNEVVKGLKDVLQMLGKSVS